MAEFTQLVTDKDKPFLPRVAVEEADKSGQLEAKMAVGWPSRCGGAPQEERKGPCSQERG